MKPPDKFWYRKLGVFLKLSHAKISPFHTLNQLVTALYSSNSSVTFLNQILKAFLSIIKSWGPQAGSYAQFIVCGVPI